ncbi:MAG: DUF2933 domain-containing protein [Chloroflexota bacterium]
MENRLENRPSEVRGGGLSKHALLMIACCAVPLLLFAAVSVFRVDLGSIGYIALLLLCPAMHLLMMRGMHNHQGATPGQETAQNCHGAPPPAKVAVRDEAPALTRGDGR